MTALQAYVCWRMDAGVVGCWAWLLLGLATERVGATNAEVAAMHKIAATARVRGMVIARLRRLAAPASSLLGWHGFHAPSELSDCSVSQQRSDARMPERAWELGVSWTRAASSRGELADPRKPG